MLGHLLAILRTRAVFSALWVSFMAVRKSVGYGSSDITYALTYKSIHQVGWSMRGAGLGFCVLVVFLGIALRTNTEVLVETAPYFFWE